MKSYAVTKQYIPEECTIALQHCLRSITKHQPPTGNYQVSNLTSELHDIKKMLMNAQ